MPFLWRILFCLSLFQVGVPELSAKQKKEEPIPVPPNPVSERVQGYLKESLNITLRATGRIEEPLDFLIRKPPRKGSLGELRRTGPKSAMVVYTPAADAGPEEDSFTYAVRSVDSPVSAPARIDIDLSPRPAVLDYPRTLDFGVVPVGDSVRLEVCIKNTGGSDAPLALSVNPPWSLDGPSPYEIKAGKEVFISLILAPETFGSFSERFNLAASGKQFITLKGSSQEPFQWPAQGLVIPSESRNQTDLSIPFSNLTEKSRELEFQWPSGIVAPPRLNIPAASTIRVPVALVSSAPSAFSFVGEVTFRSGNFTGAFPLAVRPAPARLVFQPADIVNLGETTIHDTAVGTLVIKNTGGLPTPLKMENPHLLSIRPEPSGVLVNPDDSVEFEIFAKSAKSGNYSFDLRIGAADGPLQPLKVQHTVRPSQPVEKLLSIPTATPNNIAQVNMPPVTGIRQISADKDSIELAWSVTSPKLSRFQVERRVLGSDEAEKWEAMPDVQYEILDQEARARVSKIRSGTIYILRIRGFDQDGNPTEPSSKIRIVKPSPKSFSLPLWGWLLMLLASLAGAQWLLSRNANRKRTNVES